MSCLLKVQLATVHAAHTASPTVLDKHVYTRQLPTARRQGDTGQTTGNWVVLTGHSVVVVVGHQRLCALAALV